MTDQPLFVVKVGGSLLDWPQLPRRLTQWLANRPAGLHLLVAGGGALCDVIRQTDERFSLGEERSHWLCIDALSIAARILARLLGDLPVIEALDSVQQRRVEARDGTSTYVFDPRPFLYAVEPKQAGQTLPHSWDVTTDSIAARVAECLGAESLVLLKSCDTLTTTVEAACAAGFVDRHFALAAQPLRQIAYVNLRRGGELIEVRKGG